MGNEITLHCDGSSLKNPGPSGGGVLVLIENKPIAELSVYLGKRTNNQAEYLAIFYGVKFCIDQLEAISQGITINIKTDSQLVIHQLTGEWYVKDEGLKKCRARLLSLLDRIYRWNIKYQHWNDEEPPHTLAQRASKSQRDYWRWIEQKETVE